MIDYEKEKCQNCGSVGEMVCIKTHIEWIMQPHKFNGNEYICCNCGHIHEARSVDNAD